MKKPSGSGQKEKNIWLISGLVFVLGIGFLLSQLGLVRELLAAVCNSDSVCSYDEWDSGRKSTWDNQTCQDCRPKVYPPLAVDQFGAQIFARGNDTVASKYKIFQFKFDQASGKYADSWSSLKTETDFPAVYEGDADNDGITEAIVLLTTGKGAKISLYKTGSTGAPTWQSPYFAKGAGNGHCVRVGDVDGDGRNEIVMDIGDKIFISRIVNGTFSIVWTSPSFGVLIWSVNIGDTDNQGDNEIILAVFSTGAPIVLKFAGGTWQPQPIEKIHAAVIPAIDVAKARDIDEWPGNEIVAGGNNNRIMLWKWDGAIYRLLAVSQDLGGFTQGVDAGEVDPNLAGNEIVTAAATMNQASMAYVLKYTGGMSGDFLVLCTLSFPGTSEKVCAKDLDGDGSCEIGIEVHPTGLDIYDFVPGAAMLIKRFSCVYGRDFEVGGV